MRTPASAESDTAIERAEGAGRGLLLSCAMFLAFVVIGAAGGWRWFLTAGERGYEPRPLERTELLAHVKTPPSQPF